MSTTHQLICPVGADNDGAYALAWSGDAIAWRLVEDGALLYEGRDTATTVTGRVAGVYEYRLGAVDDGGAVRAWSDPCRVEVSPPALGVAFALAAVGAAVFVATLVLVMRGDRGSAHVKEDAP